MYRKEIPFAAVLAAVLAAHFWWQYQFQDPLNHWRDGVRRHQLNFESDEVAVEYRLPADTMPDDVRKQLGSWLSQFVGVSNERAEQLLAEHWAEAPDDLQPLCETMRTYRPQTILVKRDKCYLGLYRDNAEYQGCYLSTPATTRQLDSIAACFDDGTAPAVRTFVQHFGGMRESVREPAGAFAYEKPVRFAEVIDDFRTSEIKGYRKGYDEWLVLFHAVNDDRLLISPSGELAWFAPWQPSVFRLTIGFDEFSRHFAAFRSEGHDSFTSFGREQHWDYEEP